jgi:hypothetical protein
VSRRPWTPWWFKFKKEVSSNEVFMNNSNKAGCEFHFKMDSEMKQRLQSLEMYKKTGNFSGMIVRILSLLSPHLEKEHLRGEQRSSYYELVNVDKKVGRESVHVYLSEQKYRELKLLHNDLNFYSIAQLLRLMLRVFIGVMDVYGDEGVWILMQAFKDWKVKREKQKYRYVPVRQFLHFIFQKPKISRFLTLYSNKFVPISIFRL